jgi:uncharacterized RmlC-like cupin family protein
MNKSYTWKDGCKFCDKNIDITEKIYQLETSLDTWYSCKLNSTIIDVGGDLYPPENCPKRKLNK